MSYPLDDLAQKISGKTGYDMKMNKPTGLPKIISIVSIFLGAIDLARGVMHTMLLDFAAANIAGLDLFTIQAGDLRQLMGSFGISNFITGITLILLGWKARELALPLKK